MERVCFVARVRPDHIAEYRRRHARVWPELLLEIERAGRRNYSVFLGEDGLLVGYYETDDDRAGAAFLAHAPASARWEAEMAPLLEGVSGRVDQSARTLVEVFNLGAQLAARADDPPVA